MGVFSVRKTHAEFLEEFETLSDGNYEVLSEYVRNNVKIHFRHTVCGHEFQMLLGDFRKGCRCPKCGAEKSVMNRRKTHEQFVKEVFDSVQGEYTVLSRYVKAHAKVKMIHNECGLIYEVFPYAFVRLKRRCPDCFASKKKPEDFEKDIFDKYGIDFELLSTYTGVFDKIKVRHNICGSIYETWSTSLLQKGTCPTCASSKGEYAVRAFLTKYNFKFKEQVRFKDCRNDKPLPFDFGIKENNKYTMMIEYDGEHHFRPVKFSQKVSDEKSENNYKEILKRDSIKEAYCLENNIKLIRIPYTELKRIDEILEEELLQR